MNLTDPNVQRVELVAAALGDLRDELVLIGGCAASLLIDAPTSPPPRVASDVDLVVHVPAFYQAVEERLVQRGFVRHIKTKVLGFCWRIDEVEVDLFTTDRRLSFGFYNRWHSLAVDTAGGKALPSGTGIRLISAPVFLATKFEAYMTRGQGDPVMSHDFKDIINVIEGRLAIVEEVSASDPSLRVYLAERFTELVAIPNFRNILPGLVVCDELHAQRVGSVMKKIQAIAAPVLP